MNKRQKKKLFKKRAGFYPPGGFNTFGFQIFTGIGMTKKKWEGLEGDKENMRFCLIVISYVMLGWFAVRGNIMWTIVMSTLIITTYLEERRD